MSATRSTLRIEDTLPHDYDNNNHGEHETANEEDKVEDFSF
jgi:hypothetical protein